MAKRRSRHKVKAKKGTRQGLKIPGTRPSRWLWSLILVMMRKMGSMDVVFWKRVMAEVSSHVPSPKLAW